MKRLVFILSIASLLSFGYSSCKGKEPVETPTCWLIIKTVQVDLGDGGGARPLTTRELFWGTATEADAYIKSVVDPLVADGYPTEMNKTEAKDIPEEECKGFIPTEGGF